MNIKSDQLQEKLNELVKKKNTIISERNGILEFYRNVYPELARKWIDRHVEYQIKESHEHFNEMSDAQIEEMKNEVNNLKGKVEALFEEQFSNSQASQYEEIFRTVVSNLGDILHKFGILLPSKIGSYSSWEKNSTGQFRYGINLGLDNPEYKSLLPHEVSTRYVQLNNQLDQTDQEIETCKKNLSEALAFNRWNK